MSAAAVSMPLSVATPESGARSASVGEYTRACACRGCSRAARGEWPAVRMRRRAGRRPPRRPACPTPCPRTTRSRAGAARGRSSPTGCATRGASRSTARPATWRSPTSARTPSRRSTSRRPDRARGANYGWNCFEGSAPFAGAPTGCTAPGHVPPALRVLVGGQRGRVLDHRRLRRARPGAPALDGRYVYGDFCTGELRSRRSDARAARPTTARSTSSCRASPRSARTPPAACTRSRSAARSSGCGRRRPGRGAAEPVGVFVTPVYVTSPPGRPGPPVRRRAGREDPARRAASRAAAHVPRPQRRGRDDGRRARPAVDGLRARLRDRAAASTSTSTTRTATSTSRSSAARPPTRTPPTRPRAGVVLTRSTARIRQPQRRPAPVRPRRLPLRRARRRRRWRRPARQRAEPELAARQGHPHRPTRAVGGGVARAYVNPAGWGSGCPLADVEGAVIGG